MAGRGSVRVTLVAGEGPWFVTTIWYVSVGGLPPPLWLSTVFTTSTSAETPATELEALFAGVGSVVVAETLAELTIGVGVV